MGGCSTIMSGGVARGAWLAPDRCGVPNGSLMICVVGSEVSLPSDFVTRKPERGPVLRGEGISVRSVRLRSPGRTPVAGKQVARHSVPSGAIDHRRPGCRMHDSFRQPQDLDVRVLRRDAQHLPGLLGGDPIGRDQDPRRLAHQLSAPHRHLQLGDQVLLTRSPLSGASPCRAQTAAPGVHLQPPFRLNHIPGYKVPHEWSLARERTRGASVRTHRSGVR